jgi:hypothetical protein
VYRRFFDDLVEFFTGKRFERILSGRGTSGVEGSRLVEFRGSIGEVAESSANRQWIGGGLGLAVEDSGETWRWMQGRGKPWMRR